MNITPTRKVTAATIGAAVSGLLSWLLVDELGVLASWPEAYITIVLVFAFGWIIPEKDV